MSRHALKPYRREILLAAAAVALAVPGQAEGQLMGRLKKAAAGAVADKAADAAARRVLGDSAAAAAESPAPGTSARGASARSASASASRGPELLKITSARIDTFIVAMRPVVQAAREREAYAATRKKAQEWEECRGRVIQATAIAMSRGEGEPQSPAVEKQIDALMEQSEKIIENMLAAQKAQDYAKQVFWSDSGMVINDKVQLLQYPRIGRECGAKVPMPKDPNAGGEVREDGSVGSKAAPDRAATGGWSPTQFGRLRERLAVYLVAPDQASDLKPEERAAIDARRADLKPYADAFAAGTMEWKSWGDVWSGWNQR
jgi:hypothetical protein